MIVIRLKKTGRKHIQQYRIVVEDSQYTAGGRVLDFLGNYCPTTQPYTLKIDADKVQKWIDKGAQVSPRVKSLLEVNKAG